MRASVAVDPSSSSSSRHRHLPSRRRRQHHHRRRRDDAMSTAATPTMTTIIPSGRGGGGDDVAFAVPATTSATPACDRPTTLAMTTTGGGGRKRRGWSAVAAAASSSSSFSSSYSTSTSRSIRRLATMAVAFAAFVARVPPFTPATSASRSSSFLAMAAATATTTTTTTTTAEKDGAIVDVADDAAADASVPASTAIENDVDVVDVDDGGGRKVAYRVFQTLPRDLSSMSDDEYDDTVRTIRATRAMIFAPSSHTSSSSSSSSSAGDGGRREGGGGLDDVELHLDVYTPKERREYLVRRGYNCHPRGGDGGGGSGSGGEDGDVHRMGGFDATAAASSSSASASTNLDVDQNDGDANGLQWYDVLSRYDSLMSASTARPIPPGASSELERAAIELFKYCVLYNADGHAYWGWNERLLLPFRDVVSADVNFGVVSERGTMDGANDGEGGSGGGVESENDGDATTIGGGMEDDDDDAGRYVHESFLSISPYAPPTSILSSMIRLLLETSDDVLASSPLLLPRELHRLIVANNKRGEDDANDTEVAGEAAAADSGDGYGGGNGAAWTMLRNSCIPLADDGASKGVYASRMSSRCPLSEGGYCCLAFATGIKSTTDGAGNDDFGNSRAMPVMALRHPVGGWSYGGPGTSPGGNDADGRAHGDRKTMPYALAGGAFGEEAIEGPARRSSASSSAPPPRLGGVALADMPYVSTVRLVAKGTAIARPGDATRFPTHPADLPNFFDMLFENDCLPYRKECHRCFREVANEKPGPGEPAFTQRNACSACKLECPCYCDALCKVRPPPKPVTRTYSVRPPRYRKEPERLVPKIIHQTWFEPVTKDKYPNMSRLIESWKKSGWEYYFYDDDTAVDFLATHFPPEIKEAYMSITPGAFKADLFRYCVLLIRGGVYADMDVLLQTNLDEAIANDIGFMTPVDEPGDQIGHRSCLWNGLIASAPGHPFLARTIEIVVNNIRNRFTSVDYDDMLCPNPILSVSHTVDTLFTCGPCIFGGAINNLLERHMQTEFEVGDVDIWQSQTTGVRSDDPRLLIPGRTVILKQNKNDMGAHRFTWTDRHLIVAATDMPDYDDRPPSKEHYSKTHEKAGVYGMKKLYTDTKRANEEIRIVVEKL